MFFAQELMACGGEFLKDSITQVGGNVELSYLLLKSTMTFEGRDYILLLEQRETDLTRVLAVLGDNNEPDESQYRHLMAIVRKNGKLKELRATRIRLLLFNQLMGLFLVCAASYFMYRFLFVSARFFFFVGSLLLSIIGIVIYKNRFRTIAKLLPFYKEMCIRREN